ncbi:protein-L-isoaspartate(D-aspartate) O-methyltransferase [Endothiovibrio diazotrophicus]
MSRETERARMVEVIREEVAATRTYTRRDHLSPAVLAALAEVPRHRFVPAEMAPFAYQDGPLQIGLGQTISQPYIVALMSDLLELGPAARVLEIGTGSGYQSAVLSRLVARVYTVERLEALAEAAWARLRELGYDNVEGRVGDGYLGWPEEGPFDGIIVTAGAANLPPPLLEQLRPGGRLVIPLDTRWLRQELTVVQRDEAGNYTARSILPVAFVPLIHRER